MGVNFENFGFFDFKEGDNDTYRYNSQEFSTIVSSICGNGVNAHYGDKFAVKSNDGLLLTIGSGACWVNGRYAYNTGEVTIELTPGARKDLLCAHLDIENRIIEIVQVEGTATNLPSINSDYLPLYELNIGSTGTVTIIDARSYNYGSTNYPAAQIIYSATTPDVVEGAIWLKPLQ